MIPPIDTVSVRAALLVWYDSHRRDLPWRRRDVDDRELAAYRVWVSEVMLQQTRVEAVKPYFSRWMARFPTLESVATAPLDEVMKAWEGLGYYSRARNFHRAARHVTESGGGVIPSEPDSFRALPGVGRYTAGAVMSIAFDLPEPVVDGNVRRVFARWLDLSEPREAELWSLAGTLVEGDRPGDLNQALMELGATVCTPRSPRCGECPVRKGCAAQGAGTQEARPSPRQRRPLPHELTAVAIAEREGKFLLARRPADARLGRLWEFPSAVRLPGEAAGAAAVRALADGLGMSADAGAEVGSVEHAFTHVRVTYQALRCAVGTGEPRPLLYDAAEWLAPGDLEAYALPAAQKRLAALAIPPVCPAPPTSPRSPSAVIPAQAGIQKSCTQDPGFPPARE